jgi:hypothetical protein
LNIIKGEVWLISDETLDGLDDYEGINKGYYVRQTIDVRLLKDNVVVGDDGNLSQPSSSLSSINNINRQDTITTLQAQVYGLTHIPESLSNQKLVYVPEYTLSFHRNHYKPIRHIQVKQQKHLRDEVGTSSES